MYTCGWKYPVEDSSKNDLLASRGAPSNQHHGEPYRHPSTLLFGLLTPGLCRGVISLVPVVIPLIGGGGARPAGMSFVSEVMEDSTEREFRARGNLVGEKRDIWSSELEGILLETKDIWRFQSFRPLTWVIVLCRTYSVSILSYYNGV